MVGNFSELTTSKLLALDFVFSRTFFAMTVGSSECSKCPTKMFPVTDIVVVDLVSYGSSTFRSEPGLPVQFLLEIFSGV